MFISSWPNLVYLLFKVETFLAKTENDIFSLKYVTYFDSKLLLVYINYTQTANRSIHGLLSELFNIFGSILSANLI